MLLSTHNNHGVEKPMTKGIVALAVLGLVSVAGIECGKKKSGKKRKVEVKQKLRAAPSCKAAVTKERARSIMDVLMGHWKSAPNDQHNFVIKKKTLRGKGWVQSITVSCSFPNGLASLSPWLVSKSRLRDLWGRGFRVHCRVGGPGTAKVPDAKTLCVYSIGKNGKDEKGGGDDIEICIHETN